jgi:hypothetical protein
MPMTSIKVAASRAYALRLTFEGVAKYTITEHVMVGAAFTKKVIQPDGSSETPQHDTYDMTPVQLGQKVVVLVAANMLSVAGDADVSVKAVFVQDGKPVGEDQRVGKDTGTNVGLVIRAEVEGN